MWVSGVGLVGALCGGEWVLCVEGGEDALWVDIGCCACWEDWMFSVAVAGVGKAQVHSTRKYR